MFYLSTHSGNDNSEISFPTTWTSDFFQLSAHCLYAMMYEYLDFSRQQDMEASVWTEIAIYHLVAVTC